MTAAFLVAVGALAAVAAISAAFGNRTHPVRVVIDAVVVPVPANLGYAAFVIVLAAGVANRKRVAHTMLLAYFGAQAMLDAWSWTQFDNRSDLRRLRELGLVQRYRFDAPLLHSRWVVLANLAVSLVAFAVLLRSSGQFYARVQRASVAKALTTLAGLIGGFTLVGWCLVQGFPGSLPRDGQRRFTYVLREVGGGALQFEVGRGGRAPGWVNLLLGLFGAIALFAALYALLRSQHTVASLNIDEERRIRGLLAAHGDRDSLGYFATRRDKQVIFSASGKSAVTYRVVFGVALASGDPIGDPAAWAPGIEAWLRRVREYAWTPAVMGASEDGATAYARAGLRAIELGDEAILHVEDFDLEQPQMRQVRQAVRRVERAGYRVRVRRHGDISAEEMVKIVELAARWRDTETERGFSMALGRLGDPNDGACVLVEAHTSGGHEAAILSFTPWGDDGLSLDLMRRDQAADNGLIEYMVSELMRESPQLGIRRVSLNFAVFRAVFEQGARIGAGPVLRAWRALLLFASRWLQLESLYRSNVKYGPQWAPRFLCYEDVRDLAKVGLASAAAEGFVVVPRLRTLLRRGGVTAPSPVPLITPAPPPEHSKPSSGPAPRVSEQSRLRMSKVDMLRSGGLDPYPTGFPRTHSCAEIRTAYAGLPPGTGTGTEVSVAGRVVLSRDHGGVCFVTIRDWTGDLQLMLSADRLGDLAAWRSTVDLGDHVGATGEVVASRHGEVSVAPAGWQLTAKCLRPLPDKQRGVADPETRLRQRHVDLIVNPAARNMIRVRSELTFALRQALHERGYVEVETPILQSVHGGANARPFTTHSNAYNMRLYLRIAPELYLKRLAIGGVERVFEIGRNFRNEGVDATHNPEFTMLEAYEAYGDYTTMRHLARELILTAAGPDVHIERHGESIDLTAPWPVIPVYMAVSDAIGVPVTPDTTTGRLRELASAAGVPLRAEWGHGDIVLELYERLVESTTVRPTFYTDFPVDVSPLARQHRADPRLAERWDLVAFGMELGTAYTELIDPVELRRRLTAQSLRAAAGNPEAMELDEDFLAAIEYAMPPTGGLGLGVDRLVMALTGRAIQDTLPFPLAKPR